MKKHDFSTSEAAITLCHVTRESRSKAVCVRLVIDFDDTHNDRSSSAASSQTHLSSLQRKHQVGTLCCQVRSLLRVVFVSAGLS